VDDKQGDNLIEVEPSEDLPAEKGIRQEFSPPDNDEPLAGTLDPRLKNAVTITQYSSGYGALDTQELTAELLRQTEAVSKRNSTELGEELLVAQSLALDAIFNDMAIKASQVNQLNQFEAYMRVALKAQSQCRCVWDTIGKLKHPPNVAFIKQANVAGNQQVNNYESGGQPAEPIHARARENSKQPNELLEEQHGERLDFGAQTAASSADKDVETVGAVHGTEDPGRKAQCL
jgi:hypothetical protein